MLQPCYRQGALIMLSLEGLMQFGKQKCKVSILCTSFLRIGMRMYNRFCKESAIHRNATWQPQLTQMCLPALVSFLMLLRTE